MCFPDKQQNCGLEGENRPAGSQARAEKKSLMLQAADLSHPNSDTEDEEEVLRTCHILMSAWVVKTAGLTFTDP